jgi:hypothetical protein
MLFAVLPQLNTWRLAAEQAADLAEAANQRAANCECKLADTAQQLAEQARTTLKLGEELQHARCHLDDRHVWCGVGEHGHAVCRAVSWLGRWLHLLL